MDAQHIEEALVRHERIAFQLSGGRDSTVALYLMRPYWDCLTVYHADTGDQFPELRAVVDRIEQDVPIVRVHADAPAWRAANGLPSDVVPVDNTVIGGVLSGNGVRIVTRMECCGANFMGPLHQRMLDDGMTLLVRGVRLDEFGGNLPIRSGWSDGQVEMLYPIEDWSAAEVHAYIERHALPVAPFYARGLRQAPECMGCTAWWDEGRIGYLREYHPEHHALVRRDLQTIRAEVARQLSNLDEKE